MHKLTTLGLIFFALLLGFSPAMAQSNSMVDRVVMPGEENTTGGTYCFGGDDSKRVNALWHVVGPQWRLALDDWHNHELNLNLPNGKGRETFKDGMTYYAIRRGECFFVPAPMKARVPIVAEPEETTGNTSGPSNTPIPQPTWWQRNGGDVTLIGLFALFVAAGLWYVLRCSKEALRAREEE